MTRVRFLNGVAIGIVLIALSWALWFLHTHNDGLTRIVFLDPEGTSHTVFVEVADDPAELEHGLMDRTTIDNGMLFIFPADQPLNFWMKNTLIPLNIFFFDHVGNFVSGDAMVPCSTEACPITASARPAQFAIEFSPGNHPKIGPGWKLVLP